MVGDNRMEQQPVCVRVPLTNSSSQPHAPHKDFDINKKNSINHNSIASIRYYKSISKC